MPFIEAPTTFYLGRRYDRQNNRLTEDVVYYDSRDLTTHAVVVGMTGSGKTGLCITLLEEAILDNIPAIIIDPKGDITNLMLSFPDMSAQDFQPWVNVDDARRAGMDLESYAADVAQRWRDGLQSWGIVPDRVRWLRKAAQYSIFTPGSDAGLPISILASLKAPREGFAGNEEAIREKINGITTALLALAGLSVEPVKDKEHVLVANILEYAWQQGIDLTLEDIILQVQNPPFNKLGVFPIDKYMSEKARFKLAMDLNGIVAAPSFQSWLQGQPLDIQSLLYQPNGRPRISIFYIAHLSEPERQFIITLILENMLGWMRTLSGTTSLRALLYIDEMYGYFPPYPRNPPTKDPILRLLKQARAFGVGLILATQNPGDLDYKGLTNAGTWFIGRLQSDNDKQKVMDGLRQMATAEDNMSLDDVGALIADITPRVFLMRNVHDNSGPLLVHTRWSMNYLRGPLTRQQVEVLMRNQRQQLLTQVAVQQAQHGQGWPQQQAQMNPGAFPPPPPSLPGMPPGTPPPPPGLPGMPGGAPGFGAQSVPQSPPGFPPQQLPGQGGAAWPQPAAPTAQDSQRLGRTGQLPPGFSENPPPLSSSTSQFFLPVQSSSQQALADWEQQVGMRAQATSAGVLIYQPFLLAQAVIRYQDRKASIYTARTYAYLVPDLQRAGLIHWEEHLVNPLEARSLGAQAPAQAAFGDVPPGLIDNQRMTALRREVVDMLFNTARMAIPFNSELQIYGNPDLDFSQYQAQVQQVARERRDAELDKISAKYAAMMEKLEDRLNKKEMELRAEKREIADRRKEELYTTGEALLSLWKGRTNYTLSRMSRATRYRGQTKENIYESHQVIDDLERQMGEVEAEFETVLHATNDKWAQIATRVEEYTVAPFKKDIQLELFGIGWVPHWYLNMNGQMLMLPAY